MENDIEKLIGTEDEARDAKVIPPEATLPSGTRARPRGRRLSTEKKMSVADRMKATKALGGPKVKMQLKIPEALADILCDLAEKWHQEYYKVAVQCMITGARAYADVPQTLGANPFSTPMRKNPDLIDAMDQMKAFQRHPNARAMAEQLMESGAANVFDAESEFDDPFMPQTGLAPQVITDKKFAKPTFAANGTPAASGVPNDDEIDLMNAELEQENAETT